MLSAYGLVIVTSFNSFFIFYDKNIKKSNRVVQFYFLGTLNLIVHAVKIEKSIIEKSKIHNLILCINRGGISKSSKTIVNIATKKFG